MGDLYVLSNYIIENTNQELMIHIDVMVFKIKGNIATRQNEYERDTGLDPDSVLCQLCGLRQVPEIF